ncbi:site-specific integrase [bacterium]|nr:site-specific integrase [bacterium]
MAKTERIKSKYPGVYSVMCYREGQKPEKVFYIRYRKNSKLIEEKAGAQFKDSMTEAKANNIRTLRLCGKEPTNNESREQVRELKKQQADRWTFNRVWDEYLATRQTKSIDICKNRFNKHIGPRFGEVQPHELSQLDITRLKCDLKKSGLKPGSVNKVLELLRRIINFGKNNRLINGIEYQVKLDKINDEKTEYLSDIQFRDLWASIETDSNRDAANLMKMVLFTGMRRGELFKLQKDHIDWQARFIKISDPKGITSAQIPMNDFAAQILKEQDAKYPGSTYYFPGKNNKQRTNIKRGVNRIKNRANLPDGFRPLHGLRHQFATMLASSGRVDLYTIQKLLNHKDPRMTQRYAHLVDHALIRGVTSGLFLCHFHRNKRYQ